MLVCARGLSAKVVRCPVHQQWALGGFWLMLLCARGLSSAKLARCQVHQQCGAACVALLFVDLLRLYTRTHSTFRSHFASRHFDPSSLLVRTMGAAFGCSILAGHIAGHIAARAVVGVGRPSSLSIRTIVMPCSLLAPLPTSGSSRRLWCAHWQAYSGRNPGLPTDAQGRAGPRGLLAGRATANETFFCEQATRCAGAPAFLRHPEDISNTTE